MIYAGSVVGQSIHRIDPATGASAVFIPPPTGLADDVEFAPDGTMYWTGFSNGTMNALSPGGEPRVIGSGLPGLNSLARLNSLSPAAQFQSAHVNTHARA